MPQARLTRITSHRAVSKRHPNRLCVSNWIHTTRWVVDCQEKCYPERVTGSDSPSSDEEKKLRVAVNSGDSVNSEREIRELTEVCSHRVGTRGGFARNDGFLPPVVFIESQGPAFYVLTNQVIRVYCPACYFNHLAAVSRLKPEPSTFRS